MTEQRYGITYTKPTVHLLNQSGIGVSEYAARTCYDSFDSSENISVKAIRDSVADNSLDLFELEQLNTIEHSELLDTLAWTHFHYSILEHSTLSYLVKDTSRGVLQEHSRHRIQAISVKSTRYTMSSILNAFATFDMNTFIDYIISLDMFVVTGAPAQLEAQQLYNKLELQHNALSVHEFNKLAIAKSSLPLLGASLVPNELFDKLQAGKKKRNVGDAFKWVVTDNWKVDMVVTFNLRSLKNYFTLRDSGAAYFQIQWLAQAMKEVTPSKYLNLITRS